ncbi:MAG TPA: oxygenase MpaB family protein [Candidatus Limnocylindrales bacterium]
MGRRASPRGALNPTTGRDPTTSRDPGLYGPASEAWRLNREALLLLGAGPRALLMQVAHPLVAEGVDQHSDFRSDPWVRLRGTLRSYLTIVYGTSDAARAEIRRLNALHRTIRGPIRDAPSRDRFGADYEARDPDLGLWVHATLVDSTIAAYDAWIAPLPRERRERFYAETRPVARAFGVPEDRLPASYAAFEAYVGTMLGARGPVHPTATARDLASSILRPTLAPLAAHAPGPLTGLLRPVLAAVPATAHAWTLWPSVGLLPDGLRREYELDWGPRQRLVAGWLVAAWRGWRPLLPTAFRQMPHATTADRRLGVA